MRNIVWFAVLSALACAAPDPAPLPRVLSAAPSGVVAPDAATAEIAFTGALDANGITDGRFFALCRREDLRDVLRAAEAADGIRAGAPVVAARASLADGGRRAVLQPEQPLDPDKPWAVVLSYRARSADGRPILDAEGKSRSVVLLFDTGSPVDRTAPSGRWVLPPHGPVPVNVSELRVTFDEPVTGDVALPAAAGGQGARAVTEASDLLGLDLATALVPGPLTLDVSAVRDRAGNPAATLDPVTVSECRADAAPPLDGDPAAKPGRLSIAIAGSTRGMGRIVAEASLAPGVAPCGSVPAAPQTLVVRGDVGPCRGWDPCHPSAVPCPAKVDLAGLCPGTRIHVRLATEDLAGHRGAFVAALDTAALAPEPLPVVTEVLADADAPEAGGEYVEIANLGTGEVDLAGFVLAKRTATGKLVRCTIQAMPGGVVAPGAHALVVGGAYDGRYALPAAVPTYRCGAAALLGGLPNDRPVAVQLEYGGGEIASSAGIAEVVERCAQGALERVHPAGPDAAVNWVCPGSRSPGACNASTPPTECPRRPW